MAITETDSKAVVRRFIDEIVLDRDYDRAEELLTPDYTRHGSSERMDDNGPGAFVESMRQLHEAFPDADLEVGELIAEDDLVAFEGRWSGTFEGPIMGFEPTGEAFDVTGTVMHRVREGQIAETWATWDIFGLLGQVGAIDLPEVEA